MTDVAVFGLWCNAGISVMTGETRGVTIRNGLEATLLQPEVIAEVLWRFRHVLIIGSPLRLISPVTDRTTRRCLLFLERNGYKAWTISPQRTHDINVLVMRKTNDKLRFELSSF